MAQNMYAHVLGTSWLGSAFILANLILGVGLLNFPAAFKDAGGIPTTLIVQTVSVLIR